MFSSCSIGVHGRFSRRAFAPTAEDRPFSSFGRISQGLEKCKSFFHFLRFFVQKGCSAPAGAGRCFRRPAEGVFRACGRGALFPPIRRRGRFRACGRGALFPPVRRRGVFRACGRGALFPPVRRRGRFRACGRGALFPPVRRRGRFRACGRGLLFPRRKSNQKFAKTYGFGIPFSLSTPMDTVRRTMSIRVVSVCADALVHQCAVSCVCAAAPSWAIAAR